MIEKILEYSAILQSKHVSQYKRNVYNEISFNQKLVGLKGAKGVGKTTLLLQFLKDLDLYREMFYFKNRIKFCLAIQIFFTYCTTSQIQVQ